MHHELFVHQNQVKLRNVEVQYAIGMSLDWILVQNIDSSIVLAKDSKYRRKELHKHRFWLDFAIRGCAKLADILAIMAIFFIYTVLIICF